MREVSVDPSKLLGFRLSIVEAEENGFDRGEVIAALTGVAGAKTGDKSGPKMGGKGGIKEGAKFGTKPGFKMGVKDGRRVV